MLELLIYRLWSVRNIILIRTKPEKNVAALWMRSFTSFRMTSVVMEYRGMKRRVLQKFFLQVGSVQNAPLHSPIIPRTPVIPSEARDLIILITIDLKMLSLAWSEVEWRISVIRQNPNKKRPDYQLRTITYICAIGINKKVLRNGLGSLYEEIFNAQKRGKKPQYEKRNVT